MTQDASNNTGGEGQDGDEVADQDEQVDRDQDTTGVPGSDGGDGEDVAVIDDRDDPEQEQPNDEGSPADSGEEGDSDKDDIGDITDADDQTVPDQEQPDEQDTASVPDEDGGDDAGNDETTEPSGDTTGGTTGTGTDGRSPTARPGTVVISATTANVQRVEAVRLDNGRAAAVQSSAVTATEAVTTQVQQVVEDEMDPKTGESMNGALSAVQHYSLRNGMSVFTVSGISRMRHDGFTISTPDKTFKSAAFESIAYGLTVGTRWDGSKYFDMARNKLVFGTFGNASLTDLSVGTDGDMLVGNGHVTSFSAGGYSLYNAQPFYVLGIASYSWAWSDMDGSNDYGDMSARSDGYLVSGNIGALLPLGKASLDLRVGTAFSEGFVNDYTDAKGAFYSNAELREVNGSASAKLVFTERLEETTLRPFVQAGVTQRLDQTNEIVIDGVSHAFDDADFSVFGRIGIDINHSDQIQSYFAMRGETSADREEIAGQIGLTFKLD